MMKVMTIENFTNFIKELAILLKKQKSTFILKKNLLIVNASEYKKALRLLILEKVGIDISKGPVAVLAIGTERFLLTITDNEMIFSMSSAFLKSHFDFFYQCATRTLADSYCYKKGLDFPEAWVKASKNIHRQQGRSYLYEYKD